MLASFGPALKARRKELRLTQQALADLVGLAVITIAKIEAGERFPSVETAQLLATKLELSGDAYKHFLQLARLRGGPAVNLPTLQGRLIGRDEELGSLRRVLLQPDVRLLTLKGPPGVGKTALAVALADGLRANFPGGVVFVDLAATADPDRAVDLIAQICDEQLAGKGEPAEALSDLGSASPTLPPGIRRLDLLMHRQTLLVLDTLEQISAIGPVLQAMLAAFPLLKLLVTSRRELHVRGEYVIQIPPLQLPPPDQAVSVAAAQASPAVALFIERAAAAGSDFALTTKNCADVIAICRALAGLPLAIRLAAARSRYVSLAELSRQLRLSISPLTGTAELTERHQTLSAALHWSYRLLSPAEQAIFRRLGLCEGSCTLEMIRHVAYDDGSPTEQRDLLDLLAALIDQSLLQPAANEADEQRYAMLAPVRSFAVEQLRLAGEEEVTQRSRADYMSNMVMEVAGRLNGPGGHVWMRRLKADYPDIQATLSWAEQRGEIELVARLCHGLSAFWEHSGYWSDSRSWIDRVLSRRQELPESLYASLLRQAGVVARRQGDYERAQKLLESYLEICQARADQRAVAFTLNLLGTSAMALGNYTLAKRRLAESLRLWQEQGSQRNTSAVLSNLALLADMQGAYQEAHTYYAQALLLQKELKDRGGIARTLCNKGLTAIHQRDFTLAGQLLDESLSLTKTLHAPSLLAAIQNNLSFCNIFTRDLDAADLLIRANLPLCRRLGDQRAMTHVLEAAACLALVRGSMQRAGRLFGAAKALRGQLRLALPDTERVLYDDLKAEVLKASDAHIYEIAEDAGYGLTWEEAVEYALEL